MWLGGLEINVVAKLEFVGEILFEMNILVLENDSWLFWVILVISGHFCHFVSFLSFQAHIFNTKTWPTVVLGAQKSYFEADFRFGVKF